MRPSLPCFTLFLLLLAPHLHAQEQHQVLLPKFKELHSAIQSREPIEKVSQFFSPEVIQRAGASFTYEWLDYFVGRVSNPSDLIERIEGEEGCAAYAKPYKAQAPGDWIELSTYSYSLIDGKWLISDLSFSISAHHNVVADGDLCLRLGWPWK